MLKTVEDISATKKRMRIEIPAEAIEEEIKNSLGKLKAKTRLPGYRPGKAPTALIEKRFGKDVEAEVIEKVVPQFFASALKEADMKPVSAPRMEEGLDFKRNEPLRLTMLVEVRPEIEGLNYEGVRVTALPTEVDDSNVDEALKRLREDKATYEPTEEPVKEGDLVIMDLVTKEGGKSFTGEVLKVGGDYMPPAFSENLTGLGKGGEAEFEVQFPDDYHSGELAGVKDTVKVSVKEVKKVLLPEMDDEFAKDLEFDDIKALREHVRGKLVESRKDAASKIMKGEAVRKLLDEYEFEAPESLVEEELKYMVATARVQRGEEGADDAALREEYLPVALRNVKATILLQTVAEKEGIEVTEEDVNRRVEEVSTRSGLSRENVMKYYISKDGSLEGLRHSVTEDKVLDILLERARVEEAPQ
jgi:trigger factor